MDCPACGHKIKKAKEAYYGENLDAKRPCRIYRCPQCMVEVYVPL